MANNIHLGNPKLPPYIELRFSIFKEILNNGYTGNEIRLRNNNKIRILFSEIICILCLSKKKNSYDSIKITKSEFNMMNISEKLSAKHISYGKSVFMNNDPKELFIAINELAYHVSIESKNATQARWWVEWIIEFEKICKFKKEKCRAERRQFIPVSSNLQMDIIWIVWEVLLFESSKRNATITRIIKSLLELFCVQYRPPTKRKRKYLIYFAISLLTETVDFSIPLFTKKDIIENVKKKNKYYL